MSVGSGATLSRSGRTTSRCSGLPPRRPWRACRRAIGRLRTARWAPSSPATLWETAQATRARHAAMAVVRPTLADRTPPISSAAPRAAAAHRRHRLLPPSRALSGLRGGWATASRPRPVARPCLPLRDVRADRRGAPGRGFGRAGTIAGVVSELNLGTNSDSSVTDRIVRKRDRAMARYLCDRDANSVERTMARID
jgi:hypothetical protein